MSSSNHLTSYYFKSLKPRLIRFLSDPITVNETNVMAPNKKKWNTSNGAGNLEGVPGPRPAGVY